ncbi:hypothetical protein F5Y10DRAFT_282980 [Nemania abortiva]|nr:hypothetical protein F5Y10DRAFT_282980 [Nemania abortiva]
MSDSLGSPLVDLCAFPAAAHPNGLPPNFKNPTSLRTTIIAISAITAGISLIITAGRLYVNRNCLKIADYTSILALILDYATTGVILSISRSYRHQWNVPACWIDVTYAKIVFAEVLLVGPSLFVSKAAIFLLYRQLFSVEKRIRLAVKIGLVVSFIAYFATTLVFIYFEVPHKGETWEDLITPDGSARTRSAVPSGVTLGSFSILIDLYIFTLPLPTLYRLNLALSKKIQLIALFATASFGIIASVVCVVYRTKLLGPDDSTWTSGNVAIAIVVENNVAVIVGSLPAFTHFLRLHVADTTIYRRLRSKFNSPLTSLSLGARPENPSQEPVWTFGKGRRPREWHELSDSAILKTDITTARSAATTTDPHQDQIAYTIGLTQAEETSRSSEKLNGK